MMPKNVRTMLTRVMLKGLSQNTYRFYAYPIYGPPAGPGVYVLASAPGFNILAGWVHHYVGLAGNVKQRVTPAHDHLGEAIALGARHVLVHPCDNAQMRRAVEADLIDFYQPALNVKGTEPWRFARRFGR
jgi:hypothetical protein